MERSAAIFGATGLVGSRCLELLCSEPAYGRVVAIGRTPPRMAHPKLVTIQTSLDGIASLDAERTGRLADVFCCLGTTQAKAGTTSAFQAVDRDAVIAACNLAVRAGAGHFLMVSAVGASARSIFLYNRTKGEAEEGCRAMADRLHVSIFRPSLLLGERSEVRLKERAAEPVLRALSPLMTGALAKFRPIEAQTVARAMVAAARSERSRSGVTIYEGDGLAAEAGR